MRRSAARWPATQYLFRFLSFQGLQAAPPASDADPRLRPLQLRKAHTVFQCPACDVHLLGQQHCERGSFMSKVGPGGLCPNCDGPNTFTELLNALEAQHMTCSTSYLSSPRCQTMSSARLTGPSPVTHNKRDILLRSPRRLAPGCPSFARRARHPSSQTKSSLVIWIRAIPVPLAVWGNFLRIGKLWFRPAYLRVITESVPFARPVAEAMLFTRDFEHLVADSSISNL